MSVGDLRTRGERLKHAFTVKGIEKQMALAFDLDVHQSTITRWKEDGAMSLGSACRLCEILDISLDWLILGRGFMDQHKLGTDEPGADANDVQRFRRTTRALPTHITSHLLDLAEAVVATMPDPLRWTQP